MYYRPEGWENPYKIAAEDVDNSYPNGIPKGYHILYEAGKHDGFEEGADAMLERLRRQGFHFDGAMIFNGFFKGHGFYTMSNKENTGTYTFIPDEVLAETQHREVHLYTGDGELVKDPQCAKCCAED